MSPVVFRHLTCPFTCSPNGIRTRVFTLRGWCPRPLDDGAKHGQFRPGPDGRFHSQALAPRERPRARRTGAASFPGLASEPPRP